MGSIILYEPPHINETALMVFLIGLLVLSVVWVVLFVFEISRRIRRQYIQAAAKPLLEPGMTLEKYEHEAFDWIDDLGTGKFKIQWKGLWWRMLKLYWKRILFILFCLAVPVIGWVCLAVWALNWSNGMTAMFDAEFERFKHEEAIRRNKPSARAARAVCRAVRNSLWFTVRGTWRGLWRARRAWKDLKEGR